MNKEKNACNWILDQTFGDVRIVDISGGNVISGMILSRLLANLINAENECEEIPIDESFYEQCVWLNKRQIRFGIEKLENLGFVSSVKNPKSKMLKCKVNVPLVIEKINEIPKNIM